MNKDIKISPLQIGVVTFFLSQVSFFPFMSKILFKNTHQDVWISLIIGFLIGLLIIKIFLKLQDKLDDKNILEYNIDKYGKIIGNIMNFIICLGVVLMLVLIFSKFCIFLNVNYLPNFPLLIIETTFILIIIYGVKKGFETIFRTSQILGIISILLFVSVIILNSYNFNFNNVFPIFEHKISSIFSSSIYYSIASTLPIFLLSIFPKNMVSNKEKYNKSITWGYIISSIVTFIILISTFLVLGKELIISFEYPEFIALKQIQYFYFIERIESSFSTIWIFNVFVFGVINVYFIYQYIITTFKIKNNNFLLILLSIIIVLISNFIIFNNL